MSMKAVIFNPHTVAPEVVADWPIPQPDEGEVVVRLHAASLNHRDLNLTNPRIQKSFVYGSDGAGVIEQIGSGVTNWQTGEEVIINSLLACGSCSYCLKGEHSMCETGSVLGGPAYDGTFAEYVKVPARNLVRKPAHLRFAEAAALPMAFGTAWRALITRARLLPGETLLIHGIGGGLALYSLQLAVSLGAKVIVTSGSDEKITKALQMGAYAGIHYRNEDVAARVRELTDGAGVDVVMASHGETVPISLEAAKPQGRIIHTPFTGKALASFPIDEIMFKELSLIGSQMHTHPEFMDAMRFVEMVKLMPVISHEIPLAQAVEAFNLMHESAQFGKIILTLP